jgi:hypothetical protein
MEEIKEFKAWLEKNQAILTGRNLDEIKALALLASFSPILVRQWYEHEKFKAAR